MESGANFGTKFRLGPSQGQSYRAGCLRESIPAVECAGGGLRISFHGQDRPSAQHRFQRASGLASADTALVTPQMLDELNEAVQQISSALTPFKDNTDLEQLPTIQSGVEALLNSVTADCARHRGLGED